MRLPTYKLKIIRDSNIQIIVVVNNEIAYICCVYKKKKKRTRGTGEKEVTGNRHYTFLSINWYFAIAPPRSVNIF